MGFERVFKKHPFVYLINGKYYALGLKTCALLGTGDVLLPKCYDRYVNALSDDSISRKDAWEIFYKLIATASLEKNPDISEKGEFEKLGLNAEEIQELEKQIEQFEMFFKKHSFLDYLK